jgi:hypothetical protein
MNERESIAKRVDDALNFRRPDRPPIWEMIQNRAVFEHFAPGESFPKCAAIACRELGIDATYGCWQPVEGEKREGDFVHAGDTVWYTKPLFRSLEELRDWKPEPIRPRELENWVVNDCRRNNELYAPVMYLPQLGGWEFLPGYDAETFTVFAIALSEDLPALERFWDAQVEIAVARNEYTAKHKLSPVVQCSDDVAYKTGLMVSPSILRDHFFPRFKKVIAPLKTAGIKVIWHSDGNIMSVLDDALAIGIDGINPVDPSAGMDLAEIRRKYPRLILVGNVGAGHVLRFGTPDQVRQDVRRCLREAGNGGLMIQCGDGQVMPDCPLENVLAYLDEAHLV